MNFNIDLWDDTEAKEFGEFETLELGGHELIIKEVGEHKSEVSGNVSLKVCVDIAGNDKQAGFFQKQYDENTNMDKKWPTGGCRYLSLKDEQLAYLKGFITALEKSNVNFKFNKNGKWSQLKGLRIAGQFGWEEYKKEDGTIGVATKLIQFRSLDKLSEIKVPDVKLLDGTRIAHEEYQEARKNNIGNASNQLSQFDDVVELSDDFLD